MNAAEGASIAPKKRTRKARRKEVDPAFKPTQKGSHSDSESGYESDTPPVRRQNPKRSTTSSTSDGSGIIHSDARFSETGRRSVAGGRKRIRVDKSNPAESVTHDGVINAGSASTSDLDPAPPPPSPENGKPGESSKTSWFFSRMLQGMKNFWGKTETTTTTTTPSNGQMEYNNSSDTSSRETIAYNSKESITPDPGIPLSTNYPFGSVSEGVSDH